MMIRASPATRRVSSMISAVPAISRQRDADRVRKGVPVEFRMSVPKMVIR